MVTTVPPWVVPELGLTLVTVGAGVTKVKWSAPELAEVPDGVVTVVSTVPAASAGVVAVIWVDELTVKVVAGLAPKSTVVAPVKSVPVIVTTVPPWVVPELGLTLVTVGAGVTKVKWSAPELAEVPDGVVTVVSTVPAASAGVVAVIEVAELTV